MGTLHWADGAFYVLRRQGDQPKFDIAAIAGELADFQTGDTALCILLDWSHVQRWPFEAPSAAAIRAWNKTAPLIARAVIVHDQRWNRHAAILSGLMRVGNAQVRSFRPTDCDKAIAWLAMPESNQRSSPDWLICVVTLATKPPEGPQTPKPSFRVRSV